MVLMDFLGYDIDIPYELPYYIYISGWWFGI
jgi:hypothetical protein